MLRLWYRLETMAPQPQAAWVWRYRAARPKAPSLLKPGATSAPSTSSARAAAASAVSLAYCFAWCLVAERAPVVSCVPLCSSRLPVSASPGVVRRARQRLGAVVGLQLVERLHVLAACQVEAELLPHNIAADDDALGVAADAVCCHALVQLDAALHPLLLLQCHRPGVLLHLPEMRRAHVQVGCAQTPREALRPAHPAAGPSDRDVVAWQRTLNGDHSWQQSTSIS